MVENMNCQEAQSNVLNYINHKLNKEQTMDFIEHIRQCANCQDELEIYFIMMVGLRQLDNGEVLTTDFQKELTDDMNQRYQAIQKERSREHLLQLLIFGIFIAGLLWMIVQIVLTFLS